MRERDPLDGLSLVLRSIDAIRNTSALFVLLGTFAIAGLLVAMAETSYALAADWWGPLQAGAALFVAFYGGNAAGILVMDEARGRELRDIPAALRASLASAHRLLLALAVVFSAYAVAAGALLGLLWLSRVAVTGPLVGPLLFGLAVPVGVLAVGLGALSLVVVPLAAPGVWSGALMAAVSLLTAGTGAIATFVVMAGGRVIAQLGITVVGVDVPARQLMAGLFGYGLRSLGATGAPAGSTAHAAAALVGGGAVFALALVLPGLVYLRGTCAVYLAMTDVPTPP